VNDRIASWATLPLEMSVIGQRDEADRYLSTVAFHVPSAPKGIYRLGCNSVLLPSRLVLTAAHCVCVPSRGETIRFDGSDCAAQAQVHVDYWDHSVDGGPCLRETKRGFELVGISQRVLGRPPACTRIAPYREWVEEQIRVASGRP